MAQLHDSSAIKLFGKMIPLPTLKLEKKALADHELCFRTAASDRGLVYSSGSDDGVQARAPMEDKESVEKRNLRNKQEDSSSDDQIREDLKDPTTISGITDNGTRSHFAEGKNSSVKGSKNEEISETTTSSQEKTLKKPDKILPCPRCNSKETKFCYYNNYNLNQPRHFCKNCQRYWTAGGTMRNVPVGAGRRKTKSSSSAMQYHHIVISEAIRAAQVSAANGTIHRNPSCENNINNHILTFGSSDSCSIPIASVYNLSGKTQINHFQKKNGFHKPDQQRFLVDHKDNHSGDESLITASYSLEKEGKVASINQAEVKKNYPWFPSKIPFFPSRPSRPYLWDSIPAMLPPPPTLCHPGFPVTFRQQGQPYLQGYCVSSPWDVPIASPSPSSVNQCPPNSSPTSPTTLGKHSRDENNILSPTANLEKENLAQNNKPEGRASISKTLRIDDPGETAKSTMLASLVIKSKKTNNSSNSGGLFEGFQSKSNDERSNYRLEAFSSVLRANPAALSRSFDFHENT